MQAHHFPLCFIELLKALPTKIIADIDEGRTSAHQEYTNRFVWLFQRQRRRREEAMLGLAALMVPGFLIDGF